MKFVSTRGGEEIEASRAILNGIAQDGGLYVPSSFPKIEQQDIEDLIGLSYAERAQFVLSKFLTDYTSEELSSYCESAYARFDGDPAPVVKVDDETFILELWHGPTLAFKDIALTLLPHLMVGARAKAGKNDTKTLILVATSGDTGKAALEGFGGVEGTEIVVFYPSDGVSEMQKLQMQTTDYNNVHVIAIDGNFDDAQTAVKTIFQDAEVKQKLLKQGYELSSANSINWGRLVPQIAYYVSSYVDLLGAEEIEEGNPVNFVVPCGNFGNVLAAYYAKRMGIPIKKLIVASNENNVLTDFFNSGTYNINREFTKTMSPSMDILISSNLERLLYEISGRKPEFVCGLMSKLKDNNCYNVDLDILLDAFSEFVAYSCTEEETANSMDNFFDMFDYLLDPHTAVAMSAYYKYVAETGDDTKTIVVSTASPYKFPTDVLYAVADKKEDDAFKAVTKLHSYTASEVPDSILQLKELPVLHKTLISKKDIKQTILDLFKA